MTGQFDSVRSYFRLKRELIFTPRTWSKMFEIFPAIRGQELVYKLLPKFEQSASILK